MESIESSDKEHKNQSAVTVGNKMKFVTSVLFSSLSKATHYRLALDREIYQSDYTDYDQLITDYSYQHSGDSSLESLLYVSNINEMAIAVLDGSGAHGFTIADGNDYGCAGRGSFSPFAKTEGHQVDPADKAFYVWKKCVQCATGNNSTNLQPYDYDQAEDSCGKMVSKYFLCIHCSLS